jgi:hypothetical protein
MILGRKQQTQIFSAKHSSFSSILFFCENEKSVKKFHSKVMKRSQEVQQVSSYIDIILTNKLTV